LHSLFSGMSSVSHAAAMRMAGISRGHLLIPLFGAAAVPKTAYRSEGQLGFIVLIGPRFGLTPMPSTMQPAANSGRKTQDPRNRAGKRRSTLRKKKAPTLRRGQSLADVGVAPADGDSTPTGWP